MAQVRTEDAEQNCIETIIKIKKDGDSNSDRQEQQLVITQTFLYVSFFFILVTLPTSVFMGWFSWRGKGDSLDDNSQLAKVLP